VPWHSSARATEGVPSWCPTEAGARGMDTKTFWAFAALAPLAGLTSAIAQQPPPGYTPPANYQQPQVPGGYQQPPASYPQPPAAPAGNYQQPSGAYPQPPQAPASYQQPPPANYQQPQSAPAYQQPAATPAYQQPSANYQQPASTSGVQQPPGYQQPPAGYQQPPAGYRPQQPGNYSQPPPAGYAPSATGYPQQPGNYTQPTSAAGFAVAPTLTYPQSQGAAAYPSQPPNYQQQLTSYPQSVNQAQPQSWTEEQIDPHHKHQDARHNHNHVYPDRGTVVRNLPASANVVNFAGQSYWFAEGVWFEPRGAAYMVVEPPIGLVVATLPSFATAVTGSAGLYFYANDTYYRPRPDLGGYEVVNDPVDSAPAGSNAPMMAAPGAPASALAVPASAAAMTAAMAPASMAAAPGSFAAPAAMQMPSKSQTVSLFPNNGQTSEQQARDRYDCYRFALAQTGFDPLHPKGGAPTGSPQEAAYDQVRTACLQGRGYTVQ